MSHEPVPQGLTRLAARKARTRAAIIAAAWELFNAAGFANTSIAQIAAAAGTGVGTVYGYFPSKNELLLEVLRQHSAEVLAGADPGPGAPTLDRIFALLDRFALYLRDHRTALLDAFHNAAHGTVPEPQPLRGLVVAFEGLVRQGAEEGVVRQFPPDLLARSVTGLYLVALMGVGPWQGHGDYEKVVVELRSLARLLLLP